MRKSYKFSVCSCGKSFWSVASEARHRHNFPALYRVKAKTSWLSSPSPRLEDGTAISDVMTNHPGAVFVGVLDGVPVIGEFINWFGDAKPSLQNPERDAQ